LRAPSEDRAFLADPPLTEAGKLLEQNHHILDRPEPVVLGRSLGELHREMRQAAVSAARAYLQEAGEPVPEGDGDTLLVSGHQPELFHPGVWVKNFVIGALARRHRATPLGLIIDSDAPKSMTLRIPRWHGREEPVADSQDESRPRLVQVPFDYWHGEIPYEERPVQDEALFATFPQRARLLTQDWSFEPLLPAFWEEAMIQGRRTPLVGERMAAARRTFERRWGCHNLEVPLSRLLVLEPAGRFICHVLGDLERFQGIYNDVVRGYRRRHGLRSRNHPVPDLMREGDWLEAPFWGWQSGQHRRRRLFVQTTKNALQLRAGNELWPAISLKDPLPGWRALSAAGYKLRTRALTTTMFARLFLAELFIHGIGGGTYDEVTDEIIRRFYRIEPPAFLTVSATLLLPFRRSRVEERSCRDLARELRDLRWNPQRHLAEVSAGDGAREWADAKTAWIARACHNRAERRQRFETLRMLSGKLQPVLEESARGLKTRLQSCRAATAVERVLGRRDFAFCLYPEPVLQELFATFLRDQV
jgi:hypothetical protein